MSRRARRLKRRPAPVALAPVGTLAALKAQLPKILAGLLATGAISGTGATYMKSDATGERTRAVEVKVEALEKDAGTTTRAVNRLDRRTTRIETLIELELDQHKVPVSKRPPRAMGPEE